MSDNVEVPYPHYRCPSCGKDLPPEEARITITCESHQPSDRLAFTVRESNPAADRRAIEEICDKALGETEIDTFGTMFDVLKGVNLIADVDGELGGLLSMSVSGGEIVLILLSVYPERQGQGVGSALLRAAVVYAEEHGLPSVRVAVSNDDIPLLHFYQRHGFVIQEIAVGLLADSLGSAVAGFSGIPVRDEIRLRRPVCSVRHAPR
ncbi:MAG: GNAT family N-acetyltransferase [Actinomycetota bacterium]|jgi:ribosomal protein S18 acetylase RimI-like enzyme|nr:GNAT family N-acetyltransferase [Actinomycetota bacterium]